jgi:hypothetical protein
MKWRVTLRVESLDGRILPSGSSSAIDLGPPAAPGLGSKPGGVGDGVQVFGGTGAANAGTGVTSAVTVATPIAIGDQGGVENPPTGGRGGLGGDV